MFKYLQSRIRGTASTGPGEPPAGLLAFYWHSVRQTKGWYARMCVSSRAVALIDTVIPVFIGKLVSLMGAADRRAALDEQWPLLAGMVALVLIVRPLANLADMLIRQNALIPGVTSMIRWQSHWHVLRQSWPFFQNDFAGRIANRVMQTANALRESVMASIRAVWYIAVYGVSAFALMAASDWRLGLPTLAWFLGYIVFLRYFVPRMRDLAKTSSELRSHVMARVVDSYTNILTVKLFPRLADEDTSVREVIDEHQGAIGAHMRLISQFMFSLSLMNAALLTGTAAIGIWLWAQGAVSAGVVATALPLAWQIANVAGWVSWEVTGIFESVGVVQEGMQTIAVPHSGGDRPGARDVQGEAAARKAQAHEFIVGLQDWKDRKGYEAHVGERGVKLSGGQRQRVALARVVLKDAPILVLDEATSALDSEVELAIQEQLLGLMEGKTVIAIAHRLSTIARMDRLIVLEAGRIAEEGTHAELLRLGGHYERLWRHQSGGFLAPEAVATETETELPEEPPIDEMRTEAKPEPSVDDAPVVTRT